MLIFEHTPNFRTHNASGRKGLFVSWTLYQVFTNGVLIYDAQWDAVLRTIDHNYITFLALLNKIVNICEKGVFGTIEHVGVHDFLDQTRAFLNSSRSLRTLLGRKLLVLVSGENYCKSYSTTFS